MKKIINTGLSLIAFLFFFTQPVNACTGFGAITESGTIIGKNRDYYYVPQNFGLVEPIKQFDHWHDNSYHHRNKFYAVTSAESVSMGINQSGLTAIEEDSLGTGHPQNAREYKKLQQKKGISDGMVLYAILQNFNTIDEIISYLQKIFSSAAPDFYQFADAKKILTVEVANGKFTYQILSKKNDYFTHTNTYLSPEFISSNNSISNQNSLSSSNNRLKTITSLLSHSNVRNIDIASHWLMNTNACLNTSLFRSDLQGFKSVNSRIPNDKIFGTVASMIVSNQGDFKNSYVYLMMLESITTQDDRKQLIKYNELHTTLEKLFGKSKPNFVEREFVRNSPIKSICSNLSTN